MDEDRVVELPLRWFKKLHEQAVLMNRKMPEINADNMELVLEWATLYGFIKSIEHLFNEDN